MEKELRTFHIAIARDYGHAVYEEVSASSPDAKKWFVLVKEDGTVELTGGRVPSQDEGQFSVLYIKRVGGFSGLPNPELTLQAVLGKKDLDAVLKQHPNGGLLRVYYTEEDKKRVSGRQDTDHECFAFGQEGAQGLYLGKYYPEGAENDSAPGIKDLGFIFFYETPKTFYGLEEFKKYLQGRKISFSDSFVPEEAEKLWCEVVDDSSSYYLVDQHTGTSRYVMGAQQE